MTSNPNAGPIGDILSMAVVVGVLQQWLPIIASIFAIIWSLIRFYEWWRWRVIKKKHEPFI